MGRKLREWIGRRRRWLGRRWSWIREHREPIAIVMLVSIAVSLIAWAFLARDVDIRPGFHSVVLRDIPELRQTDGPDFSFSTQFSSKIAKIEIPGQNEPIPALSPGDSFSISVADGGGEACPTLALIPGVRADAAGSQLTLAISPRGPAKCRVSIQTDRTFNGSAEAPILSNGEQIVFTLQPNATNAAGASVLVFENATAVELAGWLDKPLPPIDEVGECRGRHVDKVSGGRLLIRSARLAGAGDARIDLDLHVDSLSALLVDDEDCRRLMFRHLARSWWLKSALAKLLGAIAALVGALFVRKCHKKRPRPPKPPKPKKPKKPKQSARNAANKAVVPIFLLLATHAGIAHAAPAPRRALVVAAWIDCVSRKPDAKLKERVTGETKAIADALKAASDLRVDEILWNPTTGDLESAIERVDGPLWLLYSGHGRMVKRKSVVCLSNDDLPVDDIINHLVSRAPASLWLNTCSSAAVGIDRSDTSVFSASPDHVAASAAGTWVGAAIAKAVANPAAMPAPVDGDCDGVVTDAELFEAVRPIIPAVGQKPPKPKLRQASRPVTLFAPKIRATSCTPAMTTASLGRDPEPRRPLPPFVSDVSAAGESRRRYARPVIRAERDELNKLGFTPCGCEDPTGHCFCASRRKEGTP